MLPTAVGELVSVGDLQYICEGDASSIAVISPRAAVCKLAHSELVGQLYHWAACHAGAVQEG